MTTAIMDTVERIADSFVGFLLAFFACVMVFVTVTTYAVSYGLIRPECYARGDKMGITVNWAFHTGCMIEVQGTWLPWSTVVPVERNGKIVFVPKPVVLLKDSVP